MENIQLDDGYGTLPQQKIQGSKKNGVISAESDDHRQTHDEQFDTGISDDAFTHHDADVDENSKSRILQKAILVFSIAASLSMMLLFQSIRRQQYTSKAQLVEDSSLTIRDSQTGTIPFMGHSENIDQSRLETLPWACKTDPETGEKYYIGYLVFCSDGNKKYGYKSTNLLLSNSSSCDESDMSSPSPLIRMVPGEHYRLILINNAHVPTNLHTHGLHVAGVDGVDDITRSVDPGNCLVYHYHILDDADVGTFWYHSHRHPISAVQVGGGAYGLLIVDETDEHMQQYPKHLQTFLQRNEVTLQFFSVLDKTRKPYIRTTKVNGKEGNHLTVTLVPNEYYYFRISAVVISDPLSYIDFVPANACESRVVAYDGVYRSKVPHEDISSNHSLTTSSRVDLAVKCTHEARLIFHQGKISEGREVKLKIADVSTPDDRTMETSNNNNNHTKNGSMMASPFWNQETQSQWIPRRPYYMPNLIAENLTVNEFWNVSMDEYKENGKKVVSINHYTWDVNKSIRTFKLHQLVEFNLFKTYTHPFHVHINRMQIMEPGGCGLRFEEGQYFDSITSAKDKCSVRMQFFDFAGRVIAHCHKLKHEDKGMMVWLDITGGPEHGVPGDPQLECDANLQ